MPGLMIFPNTISTPSNISKILGFYPEKLVETRIN